MFDVKCKELMKRCCDALGRLGGMVSLPSGERFGNLAMPRAPPRLRRAGARARLVAFKRNGALRYAEGD